MLDGEALGIITKSVSSTARLQGAVSLGEERNWDCNIEEKSPSSHRETVSGIWEPASCRGSNHVELREPRCIDLGERCSQKWLKKKKKAKSGKIQRLPNL